MKTAARTLPAAAAGKPTGTRRQHSVTLHSCASVQPCICGCSTAVPPFSALLWRLNTDILFSNTLFLSWHPPMSTHRREEILLLTRGRAAQTDHCTVRLCHFPENFFTPHRPVGTIFLGRKTLRKPALAECTAGDRKMGARMLTCTNFVSKS